MIRTNDARIGNVCGPGLLPQGIRLGFMQLVEYLAQPVQLDKVAKLDAFLDLGYIISETSSGSGRLRATTPARSHQK